MGTINPRVDSAVAVGRTDVDATTMYSERAVMVLMVVGGAYVATSLMANVMSVRILSLGGWAVDAGTLTYPLTFTLRDVVHKAGGTAVARTTVVATAGFNALLALGLWAAAVLPGDPATTGAAQSEFANVLNPVLRIIAASIIAQLIAELVDTEVPGLGGTLRGTPPVGSGDQLQFGVGPARFGDLCGDCFCRPDPRRRRVVDHLGQHRHQGGDRPGFDPTDLHRARPVGRPGMNRLGQGAGFAVAPTLVRPAGRGAVGRCGGRTGASQVNRHAGMPSV